MREPDLDSLLRHDPYLRNLARALTGDDARADDLVQETWLVVLRNGHRGGPLGRRWLAGVLRNVARQHRRDEGRRIRRERRAATPDAPEGADARALRDAVRARLAEAVRSLPARYRAPILLRYFEGLAPREIAARLALPDSTVRTRLQRGIDRLRGLLRREREGLLGGLLVIVPRNGAPLPAVAASLRRGALAAAAALFAVLTLVATRGALRYEAPPRALGAAHRSVPGKVAHGESPSSWPRGGSRQRAPRESPEVRPVSPRVPARRAARASDDPAPDGANGHRATASGSEGAGENREAADSLARRASILLTGRIELDYAPPGETATLEIRRLGRLAREREPDLLDVRIGEDFALEIAVPDGLPEALHLRASHPDALAAEREIALLVSPESGRPFLPPVTFELVRARVLRGDVVREDPVPGRPVVVSAFRVVADRPLERAFANARVGDDGRYALGVEHGRSYLLVASSAGERPAAGFVPADHPSDAPLATLVLARAHAISGHVRRGEAEPAEGARVRARLADAPGDPLRLASGDLLVWDGAGVERAQVEATTAADGSFRLAGLGEAAHEVELIALPLCDGSLLREAPEGAFLRRVTPPATVEFRAAPSRLLLRVVSGDLPLAYVDVKVLRLDRPWVESFRTDTEGRLPLDRVPEASYRFEVEARGYAPGTWTRRAPRAGETESALLALEPASGLGDLRVEADAPAGLAFPVRWDFRLVPSGSPAGLEIIERSGNLSEGRCLLTDLAPGRYELEAWPGGHPPDVRGHVLPVSAPVDVAAGESTDVRLPLRAGGRLLVLLVLPETFSAAEAEPTCRLVSTEGESYPLATHGGLTYLSQPLPADAYRLHVDASGIGLQPWSRMVVIRAGRTLQLSVDLR